MKKQSRTVPRRRQSVSPTPRHLPLVDILIDTQAELQELVVASGLKVLEAMLEEDRAAVCGPRYAHQPARQAYRTGHTPSQVVLGGRKVAIRRPRARRAGEEVPLPTARAFANADPLNRRVVDQMLIGVATRQYARSLEPLGADVTTRGTSKSAVSRRFVAQTQAQLDAWRATPLDALDLVGLLIDGVHVGGHCIVVALGIDKMGAKHPLGLWEGATENATVCQGLLTNLGSRGLRTDRSLLVIVDGAKALDTAVTQTFGRAALVQRCQVHKGRNILEHLPEAQRPWGIGFAASTTSSAPAIPPTPSSPWRSRTTPSVKPAPPAITGSRSDEPSRRPTRTTPARCAGGPPRSQHAIGHPVRQATGAAIGHTDPTVARSSGTSAGGRRDGAPDVATPGGPWDERVSLKEGRGSSPDTRAARSSTGTGS